MPVVPNDDTFTHLSRALRSTSTYVIVGDSSAAGVVLGVAWDIVPLALSAAEVYFGNFNYVTPTDPDPTPVYYVTFSARKVARDTVADLLRRGGVVLAPREWSSHAGEVIPLSDNLPQLLALLSRVVTDPGGLKPAPPPIAPRLAPYATPALSV